MSGGKGGSQSTQIPKWMEGPMRANLGRAQQAQKIGYMPYMGPDVAAFSPMQEQAFQNTYDAANAFGMGGGQSYKPAMEAQDFGNGVRGYSSFPMFQGSVNNYHNFNPAGAARYDSLFDGGGGNYRDFDLFGGGYGKQNADAAYGQAVKQVDGVTPTMDPTSSMSGYGTNAGNMAREGGGFGAQGDWLGANMYGNQMYNAHDPSSMYNLGFSNNLLDTGNYGGGGGTNWWQDKLEQYEGHA